MGALYVVRHADAGTRGPRHGPDHLRALTDRGRHQAQALVGPLGEHGPTRLVTSPFRRCQETLAPLAQALGVEVEIDERLSEGQGFAGALALAEELRGAPAVVCSHGDVIPDLLEALLRRGVLLDDELRWPKASTWVITRGPDGTFERARYLPPPT